jgi:hypothetical protein
VPALRASQPSRSPFLHARVEARRVPEEKSGRHRADDISGSAAPGPPPDRPRHEQSDAGSGQDPRVDRAVAAPGAASDRGSNCRLARAAPNSRPSPGSLRWRLAARRASAACPRRRRWSIARKVLRSHLMIWP